MTDDDLNRLHVRLDVGAPVSEEDLRALLRLVRHTREIVRDLRAAIPFSRGWARDHAANDHLVTLDHKDEQALAEFVQTAWDLTEGG